MPLVPLSKNVIGSLVQKKTMQSLLIDPFEEKRRIQYAARVEHVGPGCEEVTVGDIVILPEEGWVMVKFLDDNGAPKEKVLIEEHRLLAKIY